jgi:hypothetical protein
MGVETSPRRLIVVGVVAVTRAIQVAAANTLTVAPLPIAPRADVKTCDDGHGACELNDVPGVFPTANSSRSHLHLRRLLFW